MKVLVIDDEADIRRIAQLALERVGKMEVAEADSGVGIVERVELEKPDAILLDVMMPGLDGPATFRVLRGDARSASIPVIFLTAKAQPAEIERLKALGARAVLTKPFDPMLLAAQVRAVLDESANARSGRPTETGNSAGTDNPSA